MGPFLDTKMPVFTDCNRLRHAKTSRFQNLRESVQFLVFKQKKAPRGRL